MIQARDNILHHVAGVIRSGTSLSVWYDRWVLGRENFIGPLCQEWESMKVCSIIHSPSRTWSFTNFIHSLPENIQLLILSVSLTHNVQDNSEMDFPVWPNAKEECTGVNRSFFEGN